MSTGSNISDQINSCNNENDSDFNSVINVN